MKSFVVEAYDTEGNKVMQLKIKASDESRAIEVANRLKTEGKIDVSKTVSFTVASPK